MPAGHFQTGKAGRYKRCKHTLPEVVQIASDKAAKAARKKPRQMHPASLDNLQARDLAAAWWSKPIPQAKRCQHRNKATGQQCRRWAMKGARRCYDHGGLMDNPHHKAAAKALPRLDEALSRRIARQEIATHDPQTIQQVTSAALARSGGAAPHPAEILTGIKALAIDDGGAAFRRWLAQLTAPAATQRARKPKQ